MVFPDVEFQASTEVKTLLILCEELPNSSQSLIGIDEPDTGADIGGGVRGVLDELRINLRCPLDTEKKMLRILDCIVTHSFFQQ